MGHVREIEACEGHMGRVREIALACEGHMGREGNMGHVREIWDI